MNRTTEKRASAIIRASITGIGVNVLLAAMKAGIGILSNSIAVTMDAVNNLSDALSSLITLIGTKLAGKQPDKEHPFGYGRMEFLSALIISAIVLYAGLTSFTESIRKILHPEVPSYSAVSLVLLCAGVLAKILLGRYMKRVGEQTGSGSLVASGADALNDAVISSSVIACAVLYLFTGIRLEAWISAGIAVMIIKSGIELIRDTLDDILGRRPDSELSKAVKQTVCDRPEVEGAYDLILHSYGPNTMVGSVHIEVPDTLTVPKLDELERQIADDVYHRHHVIMGGISIYSINTSDDEAIRLREDITRIVMSHEGVLQMHGFYVKEIDSVRQISFDVVLDYSVDRTTLYRTICQEVETAYPDCRFNIQADSDLSD